MICNGPFGIRPRDEPESRKQTETNQYDEIKGCPHCGSATKHKKWCPDQQIINAYKDMREELTKEVLKCLNNRA